MLKCCTKQTMPAFSPVVGITSMESDTKWFSEVECLLLLCLRLSSVHVSSDFSCSCTKLMRSLPIESYWFVLAACSGPLVVIPVGRNLQASKALKAARACLSDQTRLPAGLPPVQCSAHCLPGHCVQWESAAAVVILGQIGRTTSGPTAYYWANSLLPSPLFP